MKVKITNQVRNESLKRTEVIAEVQNEAATPSRAVLQEKIAVLASGKPELTVVKTIKTVFGNANATVEAYLYDSEADKVKASPKYVVEKNKYAPKVAEEAATGAEE